MNSSESNTSDLDTAIDLDHPDYYFNRYLSLLEFNFRVLAQSEDTSLPILERLKFLLIFSSNMDEFFEIRSAGLQRDVAYNQARPQADGIHPKELLKTISDRCHIAIKRQYEILNEDLLPAMEKENIFFLARDQWSAQQVQWIKHYFREQVAPVLTPIGLDLAHPFPRLVNKSLNFLVSLDGKDAFGRELGLAVLPAPKSLPRIIRLPDEICDNPGEHFVFLSSVIHYHASSLFPGMQATGCYQFRLTRNSDLFLDEEKVDDLSDALKGELFHRSYGEEVRLEVADNMPDDMVNFLLKKFGLGNDELYKVHGPVNLTRMMPLIDLDHPKLKCPPFTPKVPQAVKRSDNFFKLLSKQDVLLLHPYEAFTPVIGLLRQAAKDPNVVAIKQTLYRTGKKSKILEALIEAARNGKEVTAVVELRARFDEASNIEIADRLQEAGAVVVYGIVNYKTHAKLMMIVRREEEGLKRYIHLGTGNYHAGNARLYSDYSLMTANPEVAQDVHKIFQELTGMGRAARLKHLYHSPFTLHKELIRLIDQESENAAAGKEAKLIFKCNSLTEKKVIQALYRASQAGVKINLIIRGMCCLRPGIPGVSDNIEVRSIIGRFLEHTRVYHFHNAGNPKTYCSSADLMERNLINRVEACFPIIDEHLHQKIIKEGLEIYLKDNCGAWQLHTDGSYEKLSPTTGEERLSAQEYLLKNV